MKVFFISYSTATSKTKFPREYFTSEEVAVEMAAYHRDVNLRGDVKLKASSKSSYIRGIGQKWAANWGRKAEGEIREQVIAKGQALCAIADELEPAPYVNKHGRKFGW